MRVKAVQIELRDQSKFQEEGILKCRGRLSKSDLVGDRKYPIIFPRDHRLTELIKCHDRTHHSGSRATLAEVTSKYWIPKGRQKIKALINKCTVRRKLEGRPYEAPKAADLPGFRVRERVAFSKTGVDFAGPLFLKDGDGGTSKVYITLFTCCVSRAVYLDLVRDLLALELMRCLRRFSSRLGTPSLMISDNAKTFKANAKDLNKLYSVARRGRGHRPTSPPPPPPPPPTGLLSVVSWNILMPVGKSDGRRRRIDPGRLTHSCYCILQIITFHFRLLQETE